jgi:putative oxidoreductase
MAKSGFSSSRAPFENAALLLARLGIAAIFAFAAFGKIMGYAAFVGYLRKLGVPEPGAVAPAALAFEAIAALLLVIGYQTRLTALAVAGFCIASAVLAHLNFGDPNQVNHFLKNIAMAGGCLALYVAGPGAYSLSARRG